MGGRRTGRQTASDQFSTDIVSSSRLKKRKRGKTKKHTGTGTGRQILVFKVMQMQQPPEMEANYKVEGITAIYIDIYVSKFCATLYQKSKFKGAARSGPHSPHLKSKRRKLAQSKSKLGNLNYLLTTNCKTNRKPTLSLSSLCKVKKKPKRSKKRTKSSP